MESPSGYVFIIVASVLLMNMLCTEATGHKCQLSADIPELKRHFEAIKGFLHDEDIITDISFIRESILNQIQVSEQCCFLLKLGRFYLTNVFPNIEFAQKNINDKKRNKLFHNLANALLGLKTELRHCLRIHYTEGNFPSKVSNLFAFSKSTYILHHSTMMCPCGEQSMRFIEEFKREFYKMDTGAAARKAVGDLNILFHWMEKKYMG